MRVSRRLVWGRSQVTRQRTALAVPALVLLLGLDAALAAAVSTKRTAHAGTPAATSSGHIYWTDPAAGRGPSGPGINAIGRADVNGTHVEKNLISVGDFPGAIAVDASHVYWTNSESGEIGRANLNGTHANPSFITRGGTGIAVDAHHIYWANSYTSATTISIARANLDGTHVNNSFCAIGKVKEGYVTGIAVDSRHIYWTTREAGTIGRASLTCTHVEKHFISGASQPTAVAVDAHHIYWANDTYNATMHTYGVNATIGRANLNGSHANESFIVGASEPFSVAVDSGHVYWGNYGSGTIGRASLNGTHANESFIVAGVVHGSNVESGPMGLAVGR
ncbi:MAG: NHL repeat-containing protein [Solirubrobacteraceae bacterium]